MNTLLLRTYLSIRQLLEHEDGQDLVEYALLVALIALVAVSGVKEVATAVNATFSKVSATLT